MKNMEQSNLFGEKVVGAKAKKQKSDISSKPDIYEKAKKALKEASDKRIKMEAEGKKIKEKKLDSFKQYYYNTQSYGLCSSIVE